MCYGGHIFRFGRKRRHSGRAGGRLDKSILKNGDIIITTVPICAIHEHRSGKNHHVEKSKAISTCGDAIDKSGFAAKRPPPRPKLKSNSASAAVRLRGGVFLHVKGVGSVSHGSARDPGLAGGLALCRLLLDGRCRAAAL